MNSYIIWICLNASTNQNDHTVYSDIPVMSDLNDYSDKDSFEFLRNNEEQINSCDVHADISADEDNPNNLLSQSDPWQLTCTPWQEFTDKFLGNATLNY